MKTLTNYDMIFVILFERKDAMHVHVEIPPELLIYEMLLERKPLSRDEVMQYKRLRRGYLGEKVLEKFIAATNSEKMIALFDYLFEINETECQIDCMLLTSGGIILLEAKHHSGDYYVESEKLFHLQTKREIRDPLIQIERAAYLFKQLLGELQVSMDVHSYVVFTNETFLLYGATPQLPMIFRPQIPRFLQKVDANAGRLTKQTQRLARLLTKRRKAISRYARKPKYDLSEIKRGVFCEGCRGELKRVSRESFSCELCERHFSTDKVALYAASTFNLLFPNEKITPALMVDWCGGQLKRDVIRLTLQRHLEYHPNGRYSYYTFENNNHIYQSIEKRIQRNNT